MEIRTEEEVKSANTGLKWGGYAGAAYVLATYITYTIQKDARCVTFPYALIPYSVVIIAMLLAAFEKKKLLGGVMPFKTALASTYLVMFISTIVYGIFFYALFNNIAPNLIVSMKKIQLDTIMDIMKATHTPKEKIDEFIAQYNASDFKIDFSKVFTETLFSTVKGIFPAALIALIASKKR